MSNRYYIGKKVSSITESEAQQPYKKLTIVVGEETDGSNDEELVFQSIVDPNTGTCRAPVSDAEYESITGRELSITNPWATQAVANDILTSLKDFVYHPYDARDAFVPDDAEIGDVLTVNGIYSVIAKQDITFDGLATSDISAPGADETENEFGFAKSSVEKSISKLNRKTNTMTTEFRVELGSIVSTIASSQSKYVNPAGVTIDYYGYGAPTLSVSGNNNKTYLDQSTGRWYRCQNLSWVYQGTCPLITSELSSEIDQKIDSITLTVTNASDVLEWAAGRQYAVDDMCRITTYGDWDTSILSDGYISGYGTPTDNGYQAYNYPLKNYLNLSNGMYYLSMPAQDMSYWYWDGPYGPLPRRESYTYYKCRVAHTASNANKPPNATYWTVKQNAETSSFFKLTAGSATLSSGDITFAGDVVFKSNLTDGTTVISGSNIQTGSISANYLTTGTIDATSVGVKGCFQVKQDGYDSRYAIPDGTVLGEIGEYVISVISGQLEYKGVAIKGRITGDIPATGAAALMAERIALVGAPIIYESTTPIVASDRDLKKDIIYDDDRLPALFDRLRPVSFRLRDNDEMLHLGFIAQDVNEAVNAVGLDTALTKRLETLYTLDYTDLIAVVTAKVQEIDERVRRLEG